MLGQAYEDFELIISDNASTDETPEICRRYARLDSRIRYYRQADNIGSSANHNFVLGESRGELFKWASHDDLYAPQLLDAAWRRSTRARVVLAHCVTAMIDSSRKVTLAVSYPLATSSPIAPERFRSVLFTSGGDDIYGVMRKQSIGPALHFAAVTDPIACWPCHSAWTPLCADPGLALLPARAPRATLRFRATAARLARAGLAARAGPTSGTRTLA